MPTNAQLRVYRVKPGRMAEFQRVFEEQIVPARAAHGFTIVGAWVDRDDPDRFVWIPTYSGEDGWDAAHARYYDSAERAAISPPPGEFLDEILMADVLVPVGDE